MKKQLNIVLLLFAITNFIHSQNNALHFDGLDDYCESPSPYFANGDFTLESWFKSENTNNGFFNRIISISGSTSQIEVGEDNGEIAYFIYPNDINTTNHSKIPSINVRDASCHHIALVKSGSDLIIYLDGSEILFRASHFANSFFSDSGISRLGTWSATVNDFWTGEIDELRIWSDVRTHQEIIDNMNTPLLGTEENLISNYSFNQGNPGANNSSETELKSKSLFRYIYELHNFSLNGSSSNWILSCSEVAEYCPSECCVNNYIEGFENYPLGPLQTSLPIQSAAWFTESGFVEIAEEGCSDIQSISASSGGRFNSIFGFDAGSSIAGPNLIFEEGKFYCISLCAKMFEDNTVGSVNFGNLNSGNFEVLSSTNSITFQDGWKDLEMLTWEADQDYSIAFFNVHATEIPVNPLDFPVSMLIDNICISEVSPPAQCQAGFTYAFFDCGEVCFEDTSCGTDYNSSWSIDGEPVDIVGDCYSFESGGTYEICLSIFKDGCESEHCETIQVNYIQSPLVLDCAFSIITTTEPELCGANVEIPDPAITIDSCVGFGNITEERNDGLAMTDPYPVGNTIVTFTLSDDQGNSTSCNLTVTVLDEESPTIECPVDPIVVASESADGTVITWPIIEANDNCGIDSLYCSFDEEFVFPCGETEVWCFAIDSRGNVDSCSFLVVVECESDCCGSYENLCESFDAGFGIYRDGCEVEICMNELDTCQFAIITIDGLDSDPIENTNECHIHSFSSSGDYQITITLSESLNDEICFSKDTTFNICVECECNMPKCELDWEKYPGENYFAGGHVINSSLTFGGSNGDKLFMTGSVVGNTFDSLNFTSYGESDAFISEIDPLTGCVVGNKFLHFGGSQFDQGSVIKYSESNDALVVGGAYWSPTMDIPTGPANMLPVKTFQNNFPYVGTYPNGNPVGHIDGFVMSINASTFKVNWALNLSQHWTITVQDLVVDGDGNIYVTGGVKTNGKINFDPIGDASGNNPVFNVYLGNQSMYVVKYDIDGKAIWLKTFEDKAPVDVGLQGFAINIDDDKNVYVSGEIGETCKHQEGCYTFNLPANGTKTICVNSGCVGCDPLCKKENYRYNGFIIKLDPLGIGVLWADGIRDTTHLKGKTIEICGDNLYVGGSAFDLYSKYSGFLSHYDIGGATPIEKFHGHNGYIIRGISTDIDCNVYVSGYGGLKSNFDVLNPLNPLYQRTSYEMGLKQGVTVKYDKDLNILDGFNSGSSDERRFGNTAKSDGSQLVISGNSRINPFYSDPNDFSHYVNGHHPTNSFIYLNSFKLGCSEESSDCCAGVDASMNSITNTNDDNLCCFSLDIDNNLGFQVAKIEAELLSSDWVFNTANLDPNINYSLCNSLPKNICIKPNQGYVQSGTIDGVLDFCLSSNNSSAPMSQEIVIKYYEKTKDDRYRLACSDTLITDCEIPDTTQCVQVEHITVECQDDPNIYKLTLDVTNNSDLDVYYMTISQPTSGFCIGQLPTDCFQNIAIPIPNGPILSGGQASGICLFLNSYNPIFDVQDVCLDLGFEDQDLQFCCTSNTSYCFQVENCCSPCDDISLTMESIMMDNNEDGCCYAVDIDNLCGYEYFTKVELEISNPDVYFSYLMDDPQSNLGFCSAPAVAPRTVCLSSGDILGDNTIDYIEEGFYDDAIKFCLGSLSGDNNISTQIKVKYYTINSLGDEVVACDNILNAECVNEQQKCMLITDGRLECTSLEGVYKYSANIKNNSSPNFCADQIKIVTKSPFINSIISPSVIDIIPNPLCEGDSIDICVDIYLDPDDFTLGPLPLVFGLKNTNSGMCCTGSEAIIDYYQIPVCDTCTLVCPNDTTINCCEEYSTELPYWSDNCSTDSIICLRDDGLELTAPYDVGTTCISCISNSTTVDSCTYCITVTADPPLISCPPSITIIDGDSSDPTSTGTAIPIGDCIIQDVVYTDNIDGNADCPYTIERKWTIISDCGLETDCYQDIFVECDTTVCSCSMLDEVNIFFDGIGSFHPCGDTYTIPSVTQDIIISGNFDCIGDCDTSAVSWELKAPNTTSYSGNSTLGSFFIQLDQNYFDNPGTYEFSVFGLCGADACSECVIYIEILNGAICTCDGYSDVIFTTANNEYTFDCTYDSFIELTSCLQLDPIVSYTGQVNCSSACGFNGSVFNWTLEKDDVPYEIGGMPVLQGQVTTVNADGTYEIDLSSVPFWMPGKYRIGSNVNCNPTTKCECYAEWIVPDDCGCDCITDSDPQPIIIEDQINPSGSCNHTYHLENVGPCDEVEWRWIEFTLFTQPPPPDIKFTQGNEMVTFTGEDGKTYWVFAIVTRTMVDGEACDPVSTATVAAVNCGGGGHQFYYDGLLHTVVGELEVEVDEVADMVYVKNAAELGTEGINITLGETGGYSRVHKYTFVTNPEEDEKPVTSEFYGTVNGIENSLISTHVEDFLMMNGERYARSITDFNGVSQCQLTIKNASGEVTSDIIIENGDPIFFRNTDGALDLQNLSTANNQSLSNYDEMIVMLPDNQQVIMEAGSRLSIQVIDTIGPINSYSEVKIRWAGVSSDILYQESIIMFEDHISNYALGNIVYDAWQLDSKLGILAPPNNQSEGVQISWPFIEELDEYGVYHEEEWEYQQGIVLGSLLFESFGKLDNAENQNLGRVEYEPAGDGAYINFDRGDMEISSVTVQILDTDGLVYESEMPSDGLRIEIDPSLPYKVNNKGNGSDMDYDFGLYWLNPLGFYIDGEWYTGDELRIVTPEPRLVEVKNFHITPTNLKEFTFINQSVRSCGCGLSKFVIDDLALGFEEKINGNQVCVTTHVDYVHPCLGSSLTSYTWNWGDGTTDDVTTVPFGACHTYANDPSAYEITFTAEMFLNSRFCDSITVYSDGTTNLSEIDNKVLWRVYPNPLSNILTIESTYAANKITFINIYDINGKVVSRTKVSTGLNQAKVDFSNYQSGVYIIEVVDRNNITSLREKIIKI